MRRARTADSTAVSANAADFHGAFITHAHQLVRLGYDRLDPTDYTKAEETAITGDLLQAMEQVCDSPAEHISSWVAFYHPAEESPVHATGRAGSNRKRLDIRITSSRTQPRSRFCFEAKRLGPKHSVSMYLGDKGLGCYLNGEYASDDDTAGMLGYVQSDGPTQWAAGIGQSLSRSAARYRVVEPWSITNLPAGPEAVFRTGHDRPSVGRRITVLHSLLRFF